MRILITGINGFVGGHLAAFLRASGQHDLWGLTRRASAVVADGVTCVTADINDAAAVRQAVGAARPQVVYHLASQAFVPAAFRDPAATLQTNILGTLNLLLALLAECPDCRLVMVSSNEVYGLVTPEDLPIDENTPFRPGNPYAVSKLAQEMLALQYGQSHKLDVVRVRPFNHIGPGQDVRFVAPAFANQIARTEQGLQPPTMQVGNLAAERDFTDVRDMVRAYALVAEHGESGAVYNIGSGVPTSIQQLLDTLLAASRVPMTVVQDPARMRPSDVPVIRCDARRVRERTGWQPAIPLAQTLHDILDDMRQRVAAEQATP